MSRVPFMPFFGNDFFGSSRVKLMSSEEKVAYLTLLWFQWTDDGLPVSWDDLIALAQDVSERVLDCFPIARDNRRRNPALEQHRKRSKTMSSAQSKRAKSRWDIRKEGVPDECPADTQEMPSVSVSVSVSEPASDIPSPPAPAKKRPPKVTWLSPYWDAWVARFGAEPHAGQLAKHLKRPRDALGDPVLLDRWVRYLARTDEHFVSPAKFAATHGSYAEDRVSEIDALIEREKAKLCG